MTTYSYHWAARPWPQFLPRMDPAQAEPAGNRRQSGDHPTTYPSLIHRSTHPQYPRATKTKKAS